MLLQKSCSEPCPTWPNDLKTTLRLPCARLECKTSLEKKKKMKKIVDRFISLGRPIKQFKITASAHGAAGQIGLHVPHGSVCPAYQPWAATAADVHWYRKEQRYLYILRPPLRFLAPPRQNALQIYNNILQSYVCIKLLCGDFDRHSYINIELWYLIMCWKCAKQCQTNYQHEPTCHFSNLSVAPRWGLGGKGADSIHCFGIRGAGEGFEPKDEHGLGLAELSCWRMAINPKFKGMLNDLLVLIWV